MSRLSSGDPVRKKNPQRLQEIAAAALACFSESGYTRTQMADVARAARVSAGTLYLYADSKESLLHLAVMEALGGKAAMQPLPFKSEGLPAILLLIETEVTSAARWPRLQKALETGEKPAPSLLQDVGLELYDLLVSGRAIIRLLDKLKLDIPEIDRAFATLIRGRYLAETARLLSAAPQAPPPEMCRLRARMGMEIIAWAAMHRRRESAIHQFGELSEEDIRQAAAASFAAALLPDLPEPPITAPG